MSIEFYVFGFRYLTNGGIEYLRTILHLPPEIVPSTLKRQAKTETIRARPSTFKSEASTKPAEDRAGYRRNPGGPGPDKKADVGAGATDVEFVSFFIVCSGLVLFHVFIFREEDLDAEGLPNKLILCSIKIKI